MNNKEQEIIKLIIDGKPVEYGARFELGIKPEYRKKEAYLLESIGSMATILSINDEEVLGPPVRLFGRDNQGTYNNKPDDEIISIDIGDIVAIRSYDPKGPLFIELGKLVGAQVGVINKK